MRRMRGFAAALVLSSACGAASARPTGGTVADTRIWRPFVLSGEGKSIRIPEIGSPEWKIRREERAVERARRIEERRRLEAQGGLLGGFDPDFGSATPPPPYQGTAVAPHPDAKDEELRAQAEFAAAMKRSDPLPASRQAHFRWLIWYDGMAQYGWRGRIFMTEDHPEGRRFIVHFQPMLHSPFLSLMGDYVEETYILGPDGPRLIETDAPFGKPFLEGFPAAT